MFSTRDTLYMLGMIYQINDRPTEALDAFNQLLDAGYEDTRIYAYISNIYKKVGKIELAIEYMHKSVNIS